MPECLHVYCRTEHWPDDPCPRVARQFAPLRDATYLFLFLTATELEGTEWAQPLSGRPQSANRTSAS